MMSIKKNVSDIPQRKALGILSLNSRSPRWIDQSILLGGVSTGYIRQAL